MPIPFNLNPLHSTKDIRASPLFRGAISRWLWRWGTHRMTRPGAWFAAMTLAFALYGATSLDLQIFVPFTYAAGVWVVAALWAQVRPPRVSLTAEQPRRVEAGARLTALVTVQARGRAVHDAVLMPSRLPPAVDVVQTEGVFLGTLRPGTPQTASVTLRATRRGLYALRGWRVQTDFPFGVLRAYTVAADERALLVTPQWTALREMDLLPPLSALPGGAARAARGAAMEFMGNREFREGDSIRDMDWRASARLDRLVVREFHEEHSHRAALLVDTFVAGAPGAEDALEGTISLCASAAEFLARREYPVSVLIAGPDVHPLEGMERWACHERILDILAVAAPSPAPTLANAAGLPELLKDVSVVLCFLGGWDDARRAWAARLQSLGPPVRLVLVEGDGPARDLSADEARLGPIRRVTLAQIEAGVDRL